MSSVTLEWAPFTLAAGVTEQELLDASQALQEDFLARQPGFVRRELLKGSGREWADLVYWESAELAQDAMKAAAASAVCLQYFNLLEMADPDHPEAGVAHFAVARSYVPNGASSPTVATAR
jgi:hypothetical protein